MIKLHVCTKNSLASLWWRTEQRKYQPFSKIQMWVVRGWEQEKSLAYKFQHKNMCTLVTEQELVHPGKRTKHCTEVSAAWSHQGPNLCHFISKTLKMALAAQPHFVLNTEMLEQGNKTCRAYVSIIWQHGVMSGVFVMTDTFSSSSSTLAAWAHPKTRRQDTCTYTLNDSSQKIQEIAKYDVNLQVIIASFHYFIAPTINIW